MRSDWKLTQIETALFIIVGLLVIGNGLLLAAAGIGWLT